MALRKWLAFSFVLILPTIGLPDRAAAQELWWYLSACSGFDYYGSNGIGELRLKKAQALAADPGTKDGVRSHQLNMVAMLELKAGRYGAVEAPLREALRLSSRDPSSFDHLLQLSNLIEFLRWQGRVSEAKALLPFLKQRLGPDPAKRLVLKPEQDWYSESIAVASCIGKAALDLGEAPLAAAVASIAVDLSEYSPRDHRSPRVNSAILAARSNLAVGDLARAQRHAGYARAELTSSMDEEAAELSLLQAEMWLAYSSPTTDPASIRGPVRNNIVSALVKMGKRQAESRLNARLRRLDAVQELLVGDPHEARSSLVRLAQAGASSGSRCIDGEDRSWVYSGWVRALRTMHDKKGRAPAEKTALLEESFIAAQSVSAPQASLALAQFARREAFYGKGLAGSVRGYQDLLAECKKREGFALSSGKDLEADDPDLQRMKSELRDRLQRIKAEAPEFEFLDLNAAVSVAEIRHALAGNEALVFIQSVPSLYRYPGKSFLWLVTKTDARWVEIGLDDKDLEREVAALRCGLDDAAAITPQCFALTGRHYSADDLDKGRPLPFDAARAHRLYRALFGDIEKEIDGKELLIVSPGPLAALPFQVLVTVPPVDYPEDINLPEDNAAYRTVAWLGGRQPLAVLPSVASLRLIRAHARGSRAPQAFLGVGDPVLEGNCSAVAVPAACPDVSRLKQGKFARSETARGGLSPRMQHRGRFADVLRSPGSGSAVFQRGSVDVASLRKAFCPLPDTAYELRCVGGSLGASGDSALMLGRATTEGAFKRAPLDRYRIIHLATHGLLAGETARFMSGDPEPALLFTPPETPDDEDDGLLTATEITALKLDADWVVMSACNTAADAGSGREALSGLARSFFYAGARALLVSHWSVNSYAVAFLTSYAFAVIQAEPQTTRAEAMRQAMVALMDDPGAAAAHPSVWAPFSIVGASSVSKPAAARANPFAPDVRPGSGKSFRDCPDCPEMVLVPKGSFTMGSPPNEAGRLNHEAQMEMTIGRPFAVGRYEVTIEEWQACATDGRCAAMPTLRVKQRPRVPAQNVSWSDIEKGFLPWLSAKAGRPYRLPTEAEWEYAARAGTTTAYWFGSEIDEKRADYFSAANSFASAVDASEPNPWGLFHVHGNVSELALDCYASALQPVAVALARRSDDCLYRVRRGGSYDDKRQFRRSASRYAVPASIPTNEVWGNGIGLRVVRELDDAELAAVQ